MFPPVKFVLYVPKMNMLYVYLKIGALFRNCRLNGCPGFFIPLFLMWLIWKEQNNTYFDSVEMPMFRLKCVFPRVSLVGSLGSLEVSSYP